MAHSHFVHDLKVVLILMPGPLHVEMKWETLLVSYLSFLQTLNICLKSASFHLSCHHFDENAAQTPDVCCSSVTFALGSCDDFRGHVRWRQKIQ